MTSVRKKVKQATDWATGIRRRKLAAFAALPPPPLPPPFDDDTGRGLRATFASRIHFRFEPGGLVRLCFGEKVGDADVRLDFAVVVPGTLMRNLVTEMGANYAAKEAKPA